MSLHTQDFEFVKANNGTNGINEPSSRFNNLSSLGNGLSSEGKKLAKYLYNVDVLSSFDIYLTYRKMIITSWTLT